MANMNVFREIVSHCYRRPEQIALEVHSDHPERRRRITYRQMLNGISRVDSMLTAIDGNKQNAKYAVVMNNSPEWVVCDMALGLSNRVEIPVPTIFSAKQAENLLRDVDYCLVDDSSGAVLEKWEKQWDRHAPIKKIRVFSEDLYLPGHPAPNWASATLYDESSSKVLPCKIVHTSGTTNAPKGVKISKFALGEQVTSLRARIGERIFHRYLSIVPLSLLIEQIAVYLFLTYGGKLTFLDPDVPLLGSSKALPNQFLDYYYQVSPDVIMVSPSIVSAFYAFAKDNETDRPEELIRKLFGAPAAPFIACGNAPISPAILVYLYGRGIPIMEGYGLSENTSVVTWNTLGRHRFGTVGQPLDHVRVKLSDRSELLVKSSSLYLGYTANDPSSCSIDSDGWLHTGDLAEIDADGFVSIKGRIKHIAITADGRNISPEWVESNYKRLPFVRQAVVYGEGLPRLAGVLVVDAIQDKEAALRETIDAFGQNHCSDIERIHDYILIEASEHLYKEYFTITGDPIRPRLWSLYQEQRAHQLRRAKGSALSEVEQ